jgi:hypothetical protein
MLELLLHLAELLFWRRVGQRHEEPSVQTLGLSDYRRN